jgi:lipoyl(octanoyl) transferase
VLPIAGRPEPLDVVHLPGLTPYLPLWEMQRGLASARQRNEIGDLLLLLEHAHVYTNGRRGRREHLLIDEARLETLGASYVEVDRGGDITYHGAGQLVGYPILDLVHARLGVREYVGALERALLQTASRFGVNATREPGFPGIWIGRAKLAAIGVKVSRGVTYHGFSLNVAPDLGWFQHIVPCGLAEREVTSLAKLLGSTLTVAEVAPVCAEAFAAVLGVTLRWRIDATADALLRTLPR